MKKFGAMLDMSRNAVMKPEEIVKTPENDFVKEFILRQLEIKKNNIYSLFMVADTLGRAGTMPVNPAYSV